MAEAIYQLEVKLPSGENGETRTQVITLKGAAQIWYSNRVLFPEAGNREMLYVATDERRIYFWNNEIGYVGTEVDVTNMVNRIEALEKSKLDVTVYEKHYHEFTPSGSIEESVTQDVSTDKEDISSVESMPELNTTYTDENKTLVFSWTAGSISTKQLVKDVTATKATPTFKGNKDNTSTPYTPQ